jgi:hypothetical protein
VQGGGAVWTECIWPQNNGVSALQEGGPSQKANEYGCLIPELSSRRDPGDGVICNVRIYLEGAADTLAAYFR